MLFDGAALVAWDAADAPAMPDPAIAAAPAELVFISPEVLDIDAIVQAFGPSAEVITLDAGSDGLDQISRALEGRSGVGAIHLVAHGAPGFIALPGQPLNGATLDARAAQVALWSQALTADADILVYGCDVAASEGGLALLGQLAALTGADVAASTDDTGGGNWTLEFSTGAIDTQAVFSAGRGDPATYAPRLATIDLGGNTGWTTIMVGAGRDPYGDSQAGAADTDIIGDATHGSLYTAYDDKGTASVADDTLVFRMRIDNPTSSTNFGGVAIVGMDANLDGRIDLFFSVDGRNNGQAVRLLDPGTGANLSPSTTSTSALPTGWLPNNGVYGFTPGTYSVVAVSAATDPNWGPSTLGGSASDLTGRGGTDVFVSWRVPIADIALVLAKPSPTDRSGTGPRGSTGIAGYGKDTVVQYISFTQTQTGPINGDLNGVGPSYDKNASFASLGTFTSPMSASNPVPDGLSVTIREPVGDGLLAGAGAGSEASSVTLHGTTKASIGSTVALAISDGAGGSTTASATVVAGINGLNTWSVGGVDLSGLAEGTLTITASVVNNGVTASDSASVMLDKTGPLVGITQLAGTTAGRPLLSGTTDLPDGAQLTLTLDPDNNAASANLVYQVLVSGGAWTLNTATATPLSGSMPAAGLTPTTKITATAVDAAGNRSGAVALNVPTVTSQVTGSTLPVIGGAWTNIAGDAISVRLYADNGGSPGALLAVYTPSLAADSWSVNLATASMEGGGTLGALAPDALYHVVATVARGGSSVSDTSSGELAIVGGPAIAIHDHDGADDGAATSGVARPVFSGTSTVISGFINLLIDPAGNGTGDQIRYAVATDAAGNWTLDTSIAQPVAGFMPVAGLSGAALVTVTTPLDASGQSATDTLALDTVIAGIRIGTSALDASGVESVIANGGAESIIIAGDRIFNKAEDNAVVVSGSTTNVAVGSTVTITVSDGITTLSKAATVAADGSFTLAGDAFDVSGLKDTSLVFTASAGGASAVKVASHDAIAPQIVLTTPSTVKASSATAFGNVALPAGSIVRIWTSIDATVLNATVDANGDFSALLTLPNGNGNVTIYAASTATDVAGNKVMQTSQTVAYQNPNLSPPAISVVGVTGTGGADTTITSGEIGGGITISGTVAGTATSASGTIVVTVSDGSITRTSGEAGMALTRSGYNWSLAMAAHLVDDFNNGTLVITAQLTDHISGGGGGTTFIVKDVAQPTLLLVTGTPSISITTPIDANGIINAAEDDAVTISGYAVNATGGLVTVTVSDGDASTIDPTATASVGTDGRWSVTGMNLSPLKDGSLTVSAVVDPDRNAATSNSASTSATVWHDKTAPLLHITSAATVGNANPFISGTSTDLAAGTEVTVTINTDRAGAPEATYTTTVQADGSWRVASQVATPVNSLITVSASDAAGNAAQVSATAVAMLSSDTGGSASDFITATRALSFGGYAGAGQTVTVSLNGGQIGSPVTAGADGAWTLNYTGVQLANGSYTLQASTVSAGGTALATQVVVIDSRTVAIGAVSLDSGASAADYITADASLIISGSATSGAEVTVWATDSSGTEVFRQLAGATGGVWSIDRSGSALADGVYTLRASVTDASGLTTTVSQALVIDTRAQMGLTTNYRSADSTPILSGTSDIGSGRAISVTVAVAGGGSYTYATSVGTDGTWRVDTGSVVPAGQGAIVTYADGAALTISASGSDIAGNVASASKAMIIDLAAPVIGITTHLDYTGANTPDGTLSAAEDTAVILRGTTVNVADGSVIALTITDGTITYADTAVVSGNAWQVPALNLRALANGTISVTAIYIDDSGTPFSALATVLHDKTLTGNSVSIDSISTDTGVAGDFVTSDNTLVFRGGAAAGANVSVRLATGSGNVFSTSVQADSAGNWSVDYQASALGDGSYTLAAQVGAGAIASQAIVIDTAAPLGAVTVDSPVVTSDSTPRLTGSAVLGAGQGLTVTVNGRTYTAGDGQLSLAGTAWTLDIPAAHALAIGGPNAGFDGVYQVVARITDLAGNAVTDASSNELTVADASAPVVDLDPSDGATINHSVTSTMGAAVSLDDNADPLTVVEAGNRLPRLTLTAGGILDGASEKLIFGSTVAAADGSDATAALGDIVVGGVRVAISFAAGSFTIERHTFTPLTAAEAQAVLRDIQYRNDLAGAATAGVRTFGLGAVDDLSNSAVLASVAVSVTAAVAAPAHTVVIATLADDVAPLTGSVSNGGVTNDTAPVLAGSVSAPLGVHEVVALYRDGVRIGTAAVTGTSWSYADSALADGASYSYSARVENTATTASGAASAAYVITIDTSAPAQTLDVVSMSRDTGTAHDFITADGAAGRTVSGTLSAPLGSGEVLEMSADGGATWQAASVTGTAWTVLDSATHTGNWTIIGRVTDAAGNASVAGTRSVVLQVAPAQGVSIISVTDDVAPLAGIVADGGVTNDQAPLLAGSLSAPLAANEVLAVYRNGVRVGSAAVTGLSWEYADAMLADGASYRYSAVVENTVTAASGTASATYLITVDASAPLHVVSIGAMTRDTGQAGDFVTSDGNAGRVVTGSLSAPLAAGEMLEVSMDGGASWAAASVTGSSWQATDAMAHGANWMIQARVVDAAGNPGPLAVRQVTLAPPEVTPPEPPPAVTPPVEPPVVAPPVAPPVVEPPVVEPPAVTPPVVTPPVVEPPAVTPPVVTPPVTPPVVTPPVTPPVVTPPVTPPVVRVPIVVTTPEPVSQVPVAPAAPVPPVAGVTQAAPVPAFASPAAALSDAAPAALDTSALAPGAALVANGIPAPGVQAVALFAQAAAPAMVFDIDTGNAAFGSSGALSTLRGTDIGAGFAISVRQSEGAALGKDALKLVSAVVKIEAGLVPDSDLLELSIASPNITATYDPSTGTLTLAGAASAAEYEQVIQGVKLREADGGDVKDKRTIRFTIKAEGGQTQSGTKEYRGPGSAPSAAVDAVKPGKPGFMAQIAKAAARQTEGRDKLVALANRPS
ncbi:DUF4347 domain-containing protein [Massilia sp. PAMC28688]|uniref:Ig-like domain-containing protein n=1 Tax=Massilia sp. PAMC28688 TaxID=2861283 RepID=UPI001C628BFA|nr:Ig-like domain-containing protein [Massilia sp. PAMC28688]QYF92711.1 DUF4347 domain-containing protein [Massilia sp. PAMC28688]